MQLPSVVSLPDKYQTTSAFITPIPRVSLFNVWNHWLLSEFKAEAPIVLGKDKTYLEALSLRKLRSSPEVFLKYPDLDLLNLFSVQNCVPYGFFPALSQAESRERRACCGHTLGSAPPPLLPMTMSPLSPSPTTSGHFVHCSPQQHSSSLTFCQRAWLWGSPRLKV